MFSKSEDEEASKNNWKKLAGIQISVANLKKDKTDETNPEAQNVEEVIPVVEEPKAQEPELSEEEKLQKKRANDLVAMLQAYTADVELPEDKVGPKDAEKTNK